MRPILHRTRDPRKWDLLMCVEGIHTARKQHQRKNIRICVASRPASCVDWASGFREGTDFAAGVSSITQAARTNFLSDTREQANCHKTRGGTAGCLRTFANKANGID